MDVDDLVQDTYLALVEEGARGRRWASTTEFAGHVVNLGRIKTLQANRYYERQKRKGDLVAVPLARGGNQAPLSHEAAPEQTAVADDEWQWLLKHVRDDRSREVIRLRQEGHSSRAIAAWLGVRQQSVQAMLALAASALGRHGDN